MTEPQKTAVLWMAAAASVLAVSIAVIVSTPHFAPPAVTTYAATSTTTHAAQPPTTQSLAGRLPEETTAVTGCFPIDLNTADEQTLLALPGMGQTLAARIVAYRQVLGGFTEVEQLLSVEGIGEKRLAQWWPYMTV